MGFSMLLNPVSTFYAVMDVYPPAKRLCRIEELIEVVIVRVNLSNIFGRRICLKYSPALKKI